MDKKKVMINILFIMLAFALFITWYQTMINNSDITVTTPSISAPNHKFKVYLITQERTSEFFNTLNQGATEMANLLNIDYKWTAPVTRSNEEQIEFINNAVKEGADLIMLGVNDPDIVSNAIKDAKANGVKIIYVDSPDNETAITTLATDNYNAGVMAGENMLNELDEIGIQTGKIGVISANAETKSMANRDRGFRDTVASHGGYTLLDTLYDNVDKNTALELSAKLIDENSDLVGVLATNEISTTSLGETMKEKNKMNIIGVGFDETDEIKKLLNQGYLKVVIVQNPYTMGYLGMAEADAALKGLDTGPPFIDTGVNVLTRR